MILTLLISGAIVCAAAGWGIARAHTGHLALLALAHLRGALLYDTPHNCANRDCGRRTRFLRRGPGGLLLCTGCAPPERATSHDQL